MYVQLVTAAIIYFSSHHFLFSNACIHECRVFTFFLPLLSFQVKE